MQYISKNGLKNILISLGITNGDTLLIHSDIATFGTTENFSRKEALNIFFDAFMEILGSEGTLCVPAYFYEYARFGIPFDTALSPVSKELGVFAKFINSLPESYRSPNPLASVAAVGKNAEYICAPHSKHNYAKYSAFDKLYRLNAKIILLGTTFNSITFGHFAEFQAGVPYLYNKIYNIPVYNNSQLIFNETYAAVRYLHLDIQYNRLQQITPQMENDDLTKTVSYINGKISMLSIKSYVEKTIQAINNNTYVCLDHKPDFPAGQIPNDGPAIKK